jgi:phosphomannomutase/phosphoglucomutase
VDYDDGWGLVRSSNTSACLGFRFEATTEARLAEIKEQFRTVFKTFAKLELPF